MQRSFKIHRLALAATLALAYVESGLTVTKPTNTGKAVCTTTIDFRPIVYTLSVGYSF